MFGNIADKLDELMKEDPASTYSNKVDLLVDLLLRCGHRKLPPFALLFLCIISCLAL